MRGERAYSSPHVERLRGFKTMLIYTHMHVYVMYLMLYTAVFLASMKLKLRKSVEGQAGRHQES